MPGVLVRPSQVRRLRWELNHAICKYLDARYVKIRDILILFPVF